MLLKISIFLSIVANCVSCSSEKNFNVIKERTEVVDNGDGTYLYKGPIVSVYYLEFESKQIEKKLYETYKGNVKVVKPGIYQVKIFGGQIASEFKQFELEQSKVVDYEYDK